jgi:hypothetical protein
MFNPSTLEAAAVQFIVGEDISTSREEIPFHLHILIERMKKIKKQKERIVYLQERWWMFKDSQLVVELEDIEDILYIC